MVTLGITGFPFRFAPLNNVQPFTYRDGMSHMQILEKLRVYINDTMRIEFNEGLDSLYQAVVDGIATAEAAVTAATEKWDRDYAGFVATQAQVIANYITETNRIVNEINNRVGNPAIVQGVLNAPYVQGIDPSWPNAQRVIVQLTQDATGGWPVALADGIKGAVQTDLFPGAMTTFTLTPDGTGGWQATQERTVRVAHYRLPGDVDDSNSIRRAVAVAARLGTPGVVLESGKVYSIGSALSFAGISVRLESGGAEPAVLQVPGQAFDALTIDAGPALFTRFLAAPQTINTNGWVLNDATGIVPGMLAAVKSSASWYYDPRPTTTDARKSELHRVVAVSGTTVWFEDAADDGYDNATETVEVAFYQPVTVHLENITVRGVLPAYGANTAAKTGIRIIGAYEPRIINVDVEQMAYTGITLDLCYRPRVEGGHTYDSNAVPTGYGVQTLGTAHAVIIGRSFSGCRRGVDVSGGNIISRETVIEDCVNMGGGRQADGTYYGWAPGSATGIQNYGFGTHGPAAHTTYRNNKTANVQMPYELRGADEIIAGASHYGRTRGGFISLLTGSGLSVSDVKLTSLFGNTPENTTINDGGANINTRRPDYFMAIKAGYSFDTSKIFIDNVDAEVQDRFISIEAGMVPQWYFHLSNVRVLFATSSGTAPCAVLWHDGALTLASYRTTIGPIRYVRESGSVPPTLTKNVDLNGAFVLEYPISAATA